MLGMKGLTVDLDSNLPMEALLDACAWCELACLAATEACLDHGRDDQLALCVQLSLDCAEICWTTRKFVVDALVVAPTLVREQLASCELACAACAAECRRHALHAHQLRACSMTCARCEQLCRELQRRVAALD